MRVTAYHPNGGQLEEAHYAYSTLTKLWRVRPLLGPHKPQLPLQSRAPRYGGRDSGQYFLERTGRARQTRRLVSQLNQLGYQVTLQTEGAA